MAEEGIKKAGFIWEAMQEKNPLVHCITNTVTVNDCANILLAAKARPTMAHHMAEVREVTAGCDALVCNMGATESYDAMAIAAEEAAALGHPVILDPVGAGGSAFRRNKIQELFRQTGIAGIRGNASEMRAVFGNCRTVTGVDAGKEDKKHPEEWIEAAVRFSKTHGCVSIISGEKDIITDGNRVLLIGNGHRLMTGITGTGCMSSVLLGAAFSACSKEDFIWAAAAVTCAMGICGELAAEKCEKEQGGTMSFRLHLIDEMSKMTKNVLEKRARMEEV